jgi:hypothetical protein
MNCKKAAMLISESMDKKLTIPNKIRLHIHTARCTGCKNLRRNLLHIRTASRHLALHHSDGEI